MNILIVDGYNIIGAWKELQILKKHKLIDARDRLIELMADYQAYSGMRVIVVFDAYLVPGTATKVKQHNVEIIYTRAKETADDRIEKLTAELANKRSKIYVATSDMAEQNVIFGNGALRKSAREFEIELQKVRTQISQKVKKIQVQKPSSKIPLSDEVLEKFEKMRRGNK
ncbi:NYN domain-containing protein [Rummeliibacillus sp. SL167]|uniref:NYN domain-containing protein n=1 Tax=Rummeliibacillus sp. SL167 TaxID=2579792 RepID=UPI0011B708F1|nr:NYN domain-containing protein [Rummeliibacillus sp. SL167]